MTKKEMTDEELDAELEKAFKTNEAKRDHCGTAIPSSREVGIQRNQLKPKKK
ncbi:MAG: hypothetical protein ACFFBP_05610 [Promethearchaeota archaeon]